MAKKVPTKTIKYQVQRGMNNDPKYWIATLVIEEQPNFYPVHITAPDWNSWCTRAFHVEERYNVIVETMF